MLKKLTHASRHKDIISSMFLPAAIAMIFTQLVGVVATIIDGLITSIYFGEEAYSAISLSYPLVNTLVLLASFISTGCQVVCSKKIGQGKKEEANAAFTAAIIGGLVVSVLFIVVCLAFPLTMFRICGVTIEKHPEFYMPMSDYLKGFLIGAPAVMLVQIVSPILIIDNNKSLVQISALVLCVADVVGDIANALIFHGGVYGMGVATSISYILEFSIMMLHFIRKKSHFHFDLRKISAENVRGMVIGGSPTFVLKLATVMRDIAINHLNLAVALSSAAVVARGLQNDIGLLLFSIGLGIGKTLIPMTGMYYGAKDMQELKRLYIYALKFSAIVSSITGIIMIILSYPISRLYTNEKEVLEYSVFAICCLAAVLPLDTLTVALQNYLQGIEKLKLVNIINFGERFVIPVITAVVLGLSFGSKGILASIAVGKILIILMMFVIICIRRKGLPKNINDFMFLPDDFGGSTDHNYYAEINTIDDVMASSIGIKEYCEHNNIDATRTNYISLFIEEMAGNIVKHGIHNKQISTSLRVFINEGQVLITLRDYFNYFDPTEYYKASKDKRDFESNGIKIVMQLAKEVHYVNAFGINNLMILL